MGGGLRIAVTIVDIDDDVMPGQYRAYPMAECDDVGPGDEADIRQAVKACGEAEAADEQAVKMSCRQCSGKDIVDAHERDYLPASYLGS